MKKRKETIVDNPMLDYHKRTNEDYKKLSHSDKKLIGQIDLCLANLSENGKEYWWIYYG
jgi:hypothetical protein